MQQGQIAVMAIIILLAGISGYLYFNSSPKGETINAGPFHFVLVTDPSPLELGLSAEINVYLKDMAGEAVRECEIFFWQRMPGMEMARDNVRVRLLEQRKKGHYRANTGLFSMGGDWEIQFQFNCAGNNATASYKTHIPWPE